MADDSKISGLDPADPLDGAETVPLDRKSVV